MISLTVPDTVCPHSSRTGFPGRRWVTTTLPVPGHTGVLAQKFSSVLRFIRCFEWLKIWNCWLKNFTLKFETHPVSFGDPVSNRPGQPFNMGFSWDEKSLGGRRPFPWKRQIKSLILKWTSSMNMCSNRTCVRRLGGEKMYIPRISPRSSPFRVSHTNYSKIKQVFCLPQLEHWQRVLHPQLVSRFWP